MWMVSRFIDGRAGFVPNEIVELVHDMEPSSSLAESTTTVDDGESWKDSVTLVSASSEGTSRDSFCWINANMAPGGLQEL